MNDDYGELPIMVYEDELPEDMTDEEYDEWYKTSDIDAGVRMGPVKRKIWQRMRNRTMNDVVAILDDGTVEQYHVDAKRLVFEPTPEALAALQAESEARGAFIDDIRAVMNRHGVTLRDGGYDGWPHFTGSFGEVDLGEWHDNWE